MKSYIQPFEKILALRELAAVAGLEDVPVECKGESTFVVRTKRRPEIIASKLAYWELVTNAETEIVTAQSLRESTVNVVRNGIDLTELRTQLPFSSEVSLPNRRCLRYGPHGIHEYRGKFFPQLVRALLNIADVSSKGVVADPMSGSGTSMVEAHLHGCLGIGLDMNPLSIYLGRTKCALLGAAPAKLEGAYEAVRAAVLAPETRSRISRKYFSSLPEIDQNYLSNWFDAEVLAGLDDIARAIQVQTYKPAQALMWISLSNILRSVSWQKEDDLRVRKEIRLDVEIDPKKEFLEELARSIRATLAFLYQNGDLKGPRPSIDEGDARQCARKWRNYRGSVDAVITSPPYATALPYLDTDRLSLSYLGLLSRASHRERDERMIGNREVTDRVRREYWARFEGYGIEHLPGSVTALVRKIDRLNKGTDAGFRRKNLPALLSKYFLDMRDVLIGIREVLKPGHQAFVVVGDNHTIAGGTRVNIQTSRLLAEIAESVGYEVQPSIPMEMLTSRDIFRKNTMASEEILILRKRNQR